MGAAFGTPGETRPHSLFGNYCSPRSSPQRQRSFALHIISSLLGIAKAAPLRGCCFLAPPARLELTTLRLGGARSILVSYGGIFNVSNCTQNHGHCQPKTVLYFPSLHILSGVDFKKEDILCGKRTIQPLTWRI